MDEYESSGESCSGDDYAAEKRPSQVKPRPKARKQREDGGDRPREKKRKRRAKEKERKLKARPAPSRVFPFSLTSIANRSGSLQRR